MLKWFKSLWQPKPPAPPLPDGPPTSDGDVAAAAVVSLRERPSEWRFDNDDWRTPLLRHRSGRLWLRADGSLLVSHENALLCVSVHLRDAFESHPEVAARLRNGDAYRNRVRVAAVAALAPTNPFGELPDAD